MIMTKANTCARCSREFTRGDKFCQECGTALTQGCRSPSQPLSYWQIIRSIALGLVATTALFFWLLGGFEIRPYMGQWAGMFFGQSLTLQISWDETAQLIIPDQQRSTEYRWEYDSRERRLRLLDRETRLEKASVRLMTDGTVTYTEATVIGKIPITFHRLR